MLVGRREPRRSAYLRVIGRLLARHQRITYRDFSQAFRHAQAHMGPDLRALTSKVSQQTFSYHFRLFCRQQGLHRRPYPWILTLLRTAVQEGKLPSDLREGDLVQAARELLAEQRVLLPADDVLRRLTRSARAKEAGRRLVFG